MKLVTVEEVKGILDNCTVSEPIINAMIVDADSFLVKVFAGNTQMGADVLKSIEKWLVAHMIASTLQRTTTEEKLGEADFKYTGKFGELLSSTPYGQMVLMLDFTGTLQKIIGKSEASLFAIPTDYNNNYGNR